MGGLRTFRWNITIILYTNTTTLCNQYCNYEKWGSQTALFTSQVWFESRKDSWSIRNRDVNISWKLTDICLLISGVSCQIVLFFRCLVTRLLKKEFEMGLFGKTPERDPKEMVNHINYFWTHSYEIFAGEWLGSKNKKRRIPIRQANKRYSYNYDINKDE